MESTQQPPFVNRREVAASTTAPAQGGQLRKPARKTNVELILVVDDIDSSRFSQETAMLKEIWRVADGQARVIRCRPLAAGGWAFEFADPESAERFASSPKWGVDAFGGKAKCHPPSKKTVDDKAVTKARLEPCKVRTSDVPDSWEWDEVSQFFKTVFNVKAVRACKGQRGNCRDVLLEFYSDAEAQGHLKAGGIAFHAKWCRVREVRDTRPPVHLCRRCQLVHKESSTNCAQAVRCPDCAGAHSRGDPSCQVVAAKQRAEREVLSAEEKVALVRESLVCGNCKGNHSTGYGGCPYVREQRQKELQAKQDLLAKQRLEAEQLRLQLERKRALDQAKQQRQQQPPPGPKPTSSKQGKPQPAPTAVKATGGQHESTQRSPGYPPGAESWSRAQKRRFRKRQSRRARQQGELAGQRAPRAAIPPVVTAARAKSGDAGSGLDDAAASGKVDMSELVAKVVVATMIAFGQLTGHIVDFKKQTMFVLDNLLKPDFDAGREVSNTFSSVSLSKARLCIDKLLNQNNVQ